MANTQKGPLKSSTEPQCQFFVVRKKRLCRMTVKPGRQYCGEHEPDPTTEDGQVDTRIPCPNDPKHTCYISKLEKHLSICNARQTEQPPYIIHNINAPSKIETCERKPLSEISKETILQVIDKVNLLFDKHIKDNITTVSELPIHQTVLEEFTQEDRTESSRRHLRQASRLLSLVEEEGLVRDKTCYVELGAGKGQLSFYACNAWCADHTHSSALVVDRACLRHKRDNKVRERGAIRLRADLAHLALNYMSMVETSEHVVGLAKHLCGVATDYALRCITSRGVLCKTRGIVLATCCHHRCEHASYVGNKHLTDLGIDGNELNVMLGIVSWATCGDGRSRDKKNQDNPEINQEEETQRKNSLNDMSNKFDYDSDKNIQENTIDRTELSNSERQNENSNVSDTNIMNQKSLNSERHNENSNVSDTNIKDTKLVLPQDYREEVGRKAKALLDWGRVLYLRELGFDSRLCYYVPSTVSLENVCIVATKRPLCISS